MILALDFWVGGRYNTYRTNATNKANTMNRYHVSFDVVSTFDGGHLISFSGSIEAKTAELAVIAAHDKVRRITRYSVNVSRSKLSN